MKNENLALPVGITLDRFIMRNQEAFQFASGELSQLLRDIALASKILNREINRAGLADVTGLLGSQNVQGEAQQKLDVIADIRFLRALKNGGEVCAIISEEEPEIILTGNNHAKYVIAIDPLDGSSNIDSNVSIGTIFSIFRRKTPIGSVPSMKDCIQRGDEQVAAGYILYGSSTILVYTTGKGVNGFTYDNSLGEYFLSHPQMQVNQSGTIFSCNEGNFYDFPECIQEYLNECKQKRYSGRYIGSLVGDFHRNLLKGGVYLYPPTRHNPDGKLRLLYECLPLAFIIEQAGGKASDGKQRILEIQPQNLHQRSPLYIGSSSMVEDIEECTKATENQFS
ncbi:MULTISPECIES: class 1 fructose-bisphosphatase [Arcicella]|uniref:Fructose-1,6-bisphosphatase class 1 n=1 Tax=Arcicella aquatica TaxID=217141 RepID=A0ABU5QLG7_9BACT|nr:MULTISPECIES: class 1 fructose-bisphosphatase [Arcicella]MDR6562488.1 fructose-1,6-bisphosphatase I [Arcicella sp. BE51]MDR6812575.1 fructose-1,6-bisphosphatase I [Arcicella sp. BE140]MDR6823887.1 fructose-1,6-bisphosphatase I [Arcicella sp. BE139]MEA5257765.1 class 1 fructose-bisphosphatase [Arcicella aquatica]